MSGQDDGERDFDLKWADDAEHKEPSARARMLAARWKQNPPDPAPFRAAPEPAAPRRSAWVSTVIVLGCIAAVILLLGWVEMRSVH
ncbi:hypothetical protein ACIQGO_17925 [Streptomyces shenzhenensis]|uniref:SCO2583/SCO2584 N-terminal domain-containing protein n=1 Tax=Streptomyces shenzhenensis TaxID=943815 RepID=UPI0037F30A2E